MKDLETRILEEDWKCPGSLRVSDVVPGIRQCHSPNLRVTECSDYHCCLHTQHFLKILFQRLVFLELLVKNKKLQ